MSRDDKESSDSIRFLLPQGIGDTEEVERYERGGFHPVHLGDKYDDGRYKISHKLGAGGFATVWLARDLMEQRWAALKTFLADESPSVETRVVVLSHHIASQCSSKDKFVTYTRYFYIHACPITWRAEFIPGWLAVWVIKQLEHWQICTPRVYATELVEFDRYTEDEIYSIFGKPETAPLDTESGEGSGPEAPRYIVKTLDFLSTEKDITSNDICLIDFDQAFPASSPPEKMLATPIEYLAPEVAVGRSASPASDVWALGCAIRRLRSGVGPFSAYDNTSPADLLKDIIRALGDIPSTWKHTLFDSDGQPTKDPEKGAPLWKVTDSWSIKEWIYKIWDKPGSDAGGPAEPTATDQGEETESNIGCERHKPYARCFAHKFYRPGAIKVRDAYLSGYGDDWETLLEGLPKIPEDEAVLLYDLLSKIFGHKPAERVSAPELLSHPWFHMDEMRGIYC